MLQGCGCFIGMGLLAGFAAWLFPDGKWASIFVVAVLFVVIFCASRK